MITKLELNADEMEMIREYVDALDGAKRDLEVIMTLLGRRAGIRRATFEGIDGNSVIFNVPELAAETMHPEFGGVRPLATEERK